MNELKIVIIEFPQKALLKIMNEKFFSSKKILVYGISLEGE